MADGMQWESKILVLIGWVNCMLSTEIWRSCLKCILVLLIDEMEDPHCKVLHVCCFVRGYSACRVTLLTLGVAKFALGSVE